MVTVILLNWKRSENLKEIIKSLRSQSIPVEIFLWNNNKEDTFQYDVDLQINSSKNLVCWPRWFLSTYASNEHIAVMDDDIIMSDDNVLKDCLDYVKNKDTAIGYTGVILNENKDYWKSRHVILPSMGDTKVDIIKGRFMFLNKSFISNLKMTPKIIFDQHKIEDDIIISKELNEKIIPDFLRGRFTNLTSNDALSNSRGHRERRSIVTEEMFKL
jgi:GT2 family glycosyltransferase